MDYGDENSDIDEAYGEEYDNEHDYQEEENSQRLYERDRYSKVGGNSFSYYQHFNRKVNSGVYNSYGNDSREPSGNDDARRHFNSRKDYESQQYSSGELYTDQSYRAAFQSRKQFQEDPRQPYKGG